MRYVLEALGRRLRDGSLGPIVGVPTSERTAQLSTELGIPLATLDEQPRLDIAIDGADEIDPALDLIKGLGGALLREKIVAAAASEFLVVADSTKLVPALGTQAPLPIEIIPFARATVVRRLADLPGTFVLRVSDAGGPFVTDEGNWILDYHSGAIKDPAALENFLNQIPGIVEHGLFLGMARRAVVAGPDGVRIIERSSTS